MNQLLALLAVVMLLCISGCGPSIDSSAQAQQSQSQIAVEEITSLPVRQVVESAMDQSTKTTIYDPSYQSLDYPNGDVPIERGVCADVIIRAFRAAGVDLQKEVYEDMRGNFGVYPHEWGASTPDRNIDHRRVANLMKYFERRDVDLKIQSQGGDFQPGDVIAWKLGNGRLHIGILTNQRSPDGKRLMVAHNIGRGVQIEDRLFEWEMIGHYRYFE